MDRASFVSKQLDNSFWTSPNYPNTIFGVRRYNSGLITNYNYPFQLLITFYAPGYSFLADTTQELGGVAMDGTISYMYGSMNGQLVTPDKIVWNGLIAGKPVEWNRATIAPNTQNDQYSAQSVMAAAKANSAFISDREERTYWYPPYSV